MFESFGVGLTLPQLGVHVTRDAVRVFCERAEALGFTSLWVQEHLFFALEPSAPYAARPSNKVNAMPSTGVCGLRPTLAGSTASRTQRPGVGILRCAVSRRPS